MRVESLNHFLNRKLDEEPARVQAGLQDMVSRYKRDPRTMSALIDTMAEGKELKDFAQKPNTVVPPEQRGTLPLLTANQRGSAQYTALEGVARPGTAQALSAAPDARKSTGQQTEKSKDSEQGK